MKLNADMGLFTKPSIVKMPVHEMPIPIMRECMRFNVCLYIACLWVILALGINAAWADDENWQSLPTKYTVLHFQSQRDLEQFNRKIDYSSGGGFGTLFGSSDGKNFNDRLIQKVDALFVRTQDILDMRKYMRRVQINIYPDKESLHEVFISISGLKLGVLPVRQSQGEFRAWYTFEQHTIYLQINDITEGMLAHEMAHSIIDDFFQVRPPAASAEIMARYVDAHINDR